MSYMPHFTGEDIKRQIVESEIRVSRDTTQWMYEYLYAFSSGIFLPYHSVSRPDLKKKLVLWSSGFSRLFCCQCLGVGEWGDDWITLILESTHVSYQILFTQPGHKYLVCLLIQFPNTWNSVEILTVKMLPIVSTGSLLQRFI